MPRAEKPGDLRRKQLALPLDAPKEIVRSKIADIQHEWHGFTAKSPPTKDKNPAVPQVPAKNEGAAERADLAKEAEARAGAPAGDPNDVHKRHAADSRSPALRRAIWMFAGVVAVLLAGAAIVYLTRTRPAAARISLPQPIPASSMTRAQPVQPDDPYNSIVLFAQSLDRLNFRLAACPGGPERALLEVHRQAGPSVCPFVWSDGQVSLNFDGGEVDLSSLTNTLSGCVAAVERLH